MCQMGEAHILRGAEVIQSPAEAVFKVSDFAAREKLCWLSSRGWVGQSHPHAKPPRARQNLERTYTACRCLQTSISTTSSSHPA